MTDPKTPKAPGVHVCRGELRLARKAADPLREVPLNPDPLSVFARAFEEVRFDRGERALVTLDLLPATPGERRRLGRMLARQAKQSASRNGSGGGFVQNFGRDLGREFGLNGASNGGRSRAPDRTAGEMVAQRRDLQQIASKRLVPQGMFWTQVLIRTQAGSEERAGMIFRGLLAAFEVYAGENNLRVSGLDIGVAFLGSDRWWRRRWFDYRLETGWFRPAGPRGGNVVNVSEIAGLLKPATVRCPEDSVVRAGPWMPAAPPTLPSYLDRAGKPRRGVLPLGLTHGRDGVQRMVGMNMDEYLFGTLCGQSGMGKTEAALGQFLHVALVEREMGCLFFDPHIDAINRVMPYLTAPGVRERVLLMNLADDDLSKTHVGWNLLSMQGLDERHIVQRKNAVCDSFVIAAGNSFMGRSSAILTAAVNALLYVAMELPGELAPTIYTIERLLTDDDFRGAVVARIPERLRGYWRNTFVGYPPGATAPVLQLLSELEDPVVRATFGSPVSTFDPRQALDDGKIILLAPPGTQDQKVCSLIMRGFIDAARSRRDVAEHLRRLSWWWMDEAPIWDRAVRNSSALAVMFNELRKLKIRGTPQAQNPEGYCDPTWTAIRTNASMIATFRTEPKAAKGFDQLWGGVDAARAVSRLRLHQFIVQPTHNGMRGDPFRVMGVPIHDLFAEHHHPEQLPDLVAAIDRACRPRTVRETLKAIEGHDDRILQALRNSGGPGNGGGSPAPKTPKGSGPVTGRGGEVIPMRPSRDQQLSWDPEA